MTRGGRTAAIGLLLWLLLALPPLRPALQATMTAQMLLQLPFLALAGWLIAAGVPRPVREGIARWNGHGIAGLLLASFTGALWMIPRMMDASATDPWATAAKLLSVPLLIGLPIALSWPLAGFVVRGVFVLEGVATAFRLGWLYLISPDRLCANYLLGDQQRLGRGLIAIGVLLTAVLAWQLIWGRVRVAEGGEP